jgi:hypothetical protein
MIKKNNLFDPLKKFFCFLIYSPLKFYRGEYSLAFSFWLYSFFIIFLYVTLISITFFVLRNIPELLGGYEVFTLENFVKTTTFSKIIEFITILFAIYVSIIGVWRAGNKYKGHWIYISLSRVILIIYFTYMIYNQIRSY